MTIGLIVLLSLISLASVGWILGQPYRAVMVPVFVPSVVAFVPDVTFDHQGLV